MTGRYALVFPGQGAQKVGMGRELHDAFDAARATFSEADAALGEPLSRLVFEGPADTLTLTANTQPSILTVSVAALRALAGRIALAPAFVAGHSLGEYSALVASGAMSFADAVRTTRARGTFMQQAVPSGQGAMAAVMKRSEAEVADACAAAAQGEVVSPANFNSPDQIVISGHAGAVARASALLKDGGGRVIPLKVSAPFHCALMRPAAERLDGFLGDIRFDAPAIPVVTNAEAVPNADAARIRGLLVTQVTSPVRWTDSVRHMLSHGVTTFIELGPGNVLAGLIGKIDGAAKVVSAGDPGGIEAAAEALAALG
jgi:[acyl-carrier-protein] S-malonyltransferase